MSPNVQDGGGAETPSRKRTLQDFLSAGKQPKLPNIPATPSKLRLVTDAEDMVVDTKENTATHTTDLPPDPLPESPLSDLSDMSDGPLSLMTDAGSNSSMPVTPGKSKSDAGSAQLVITIDSTPPTGSKPLSSTTASPTSSPSSTNGQPPAKRKKLTPAEREEKAKADLARKQEKEKAEAAKKLEKEKAEAAKKQERDEQKALAEAKRKALAEEKEKKRKQKEEEDQRKAEEKERKRKEKEDEERKIQEAKNKKERSQLRLNSFFKTGNTSAPASTTSTTSATPSTINSAATSTFASGLLLTSPHKNASSSPAKAVVGSPQKGVAVAAEGAASDATTSTAAAAAAAQVSEYDRIFKPFFIKENVIMATHLYGMDDETKEAKSRILDDYLSGARGDFAPCKPFSSAAAVDYFHLPCDKQQRPLRRGQSAATRPSVRKIMNAMHDFGYGAGSSNAQTKMALDLLKKVPMKYLFFREDVRPAYFGTVTSQPPQARLSKLARNPLIKTILPLNYDYDSEAEWVDDGDGEDVDDLDDDEEDLNDDDGEMSDFLDDSEEGGMPLRPAFSGGMEPDSTGICWENLESSSHQDALPRPELSNYRMEFIIDHSGPIDPFSTKYWEAPEPVETVSSKAASQPAATPADAFAALNATTAAATTALPTPPSDPKKAGVAAEFVPDLKRGILQYAKMTKLGIVEILSVEFVGKCTKAQIKNSIDALAERTGTGQNKTWKLKS